LLNIALYGFVQMFIVFRDNYQCGKSMIEKVSSLGYS